MPRPLTIAVCQYAPRVPEVEHNRRLAVEWATRAAEAGATLIVLPELASSGYTFLREEDAAVSAEAPDGPFVTALAEVAARFDCTIIAGFNERDGEHRHNSAAVIGPAGALAVYRKIHLFFDEQTWFSPGSGLVVVDLPWGRLGVVICYDLRFPEAMRAQALAGIDVLAVPTNWVSNFKREVYDARGLTQGGVMAMGTAAQNGIVIACADRVGSEPSPHTDDVGFVGASVIAGPRGWLLAGPASATDDELLIATFDLDEVLAVRQSTPRNHLLNDRRPDAYNVTVVGARPSPPSRFSARPF